MLMLIRNWERFKEANESQDVFEVEEFKELMLKTYPVLTEADGKSEVSREYCALVSKMALAVERPKDMNHAAAKELVTHMLYLFNNGKVKGLFPNGFFMTIFGMPCTIDTNTFDLQPLLDIMNAADACLY